MVGVFADLSRLFKNNKFFVYTIEMSTLPSIDWQLKFSEIKQRTGHLLITGHWSDCTFLVGIEPNQVTMNAHKLILASASPVFEAMFFGGMAEKNGPIKISDIQPEVFTILLEYIYMDKTFIKSFELASAVYYCANKYMLPSLVKECTDFLSLNLNPHNVCRTYRVAQLFDEKCLMEKCIKKMMTSTKEIINDESFEAIDLETLNTMLSLEHLNVDNELELFKAVEKYVSTHKVSKRHIDSTDEFVSPEKKFKSNNIQESVENITTDINDNQMSVAPTELPTGGVENKQKTQHTSHLLLDKQQTQLSSDGVNTIDCEHNDSQSSDDSRSIEDRDRGIRSALEKIRFLTLSAQQFALGPARSTLLSQADAFALLMNILSSHSDVPMPQGFSTCRVPRNPTVCSEAETAPSAAVFRFTVLGLRARRRAVVSRPFPFHGLQWTMRLVPHIENDTSGKEFKYYGLFFNGQAQAWAVNVSVHARVISAKESHATHATPYVKMTRRFSKSEPEWGFGRFVSWDDIADPSKSIFIGNAITIEAYVVVL